MFSASPAVVAAPPVAPTPLEREHGCCDDINWRCELPAAFAREPVEAYFVRSGFESRCSHPNLAVLRHPEGHELAWVVATGRVQIRVHLAVERDSREPIARQLHAILVECLSQQAGEAGA